MIKWVKFGPVKLLHIYVAHCSVNTIGLYGLHIGGLLRPVYMIDCNGDLFITTGGLMGLKSHCRNCIFEHLHRTP